VSTLTVVLVTVGLIILSAFFVIIEFSLMAARRHRLEAEAVDKLSARAALRGMNELTIILAGAQLGITACTFALGAVTKPAMEYSLGPALETLGLPNFFAGALAFALSLIVVTFLHLVVGEMAPKSWAIAHPEIAAKAIGVASRVYLWPIRPFLTWVNNIAAALVRRVGETPVDRAAVGGQNADTIRQLVEHSAEVGVLEPQLKNQIAEAIRLQGITAADIVTEREISAVAASATVAQLQDESRRGGHLRVLTRDAGELTGYVHVRDALSLPADASISSLIRPCHRVRAETPVYEMLREMREAGVQLALVDTPSGPQVLTIKDVIKRMLPQFSGPTS
jgi:CBS domain containing-hemolysin-like protein